jgi:hypothetical protein
MLLTDAIKAVAESLVELDLTTPKLRHVAAVALQATTPGCRLALIERHLGECIAKIERGRNMQHITEADFKSPVRRDL